MEILIFLHVSEEQKYWDILIYLLKPKYFLSPCIKNTILLLSYTALWYNQGSFIC